MNQVHRDNILSTLRKNIREKNTICSDICAFTHKVQHISMSNQKSNKCIFAIRLTSQNFSTYQIGEGFLN